MVEQCLMPKGKANCHVMWCLVMLWAAMRIAGVCSSPPKEGCNNPTRQICCESSFGVKNVGTFHPTSKYVYKRCF